ncbi:MAG: hypothetical protein Q4B42_04420 [Oscillospiraceae bacterium]|nr:hypothetical protein [Oscillospiraceae bacterium]
MKLKILALTLIFAFITTLTGCASSSAELAYRLTAGIIALDWSEGLYTVSLVCLDPRGAKQGDEAELQYLAAQSVSLKEALTKIEESTPQTVFYGHAAAIIIGESALQEQLEELLVFFAEDNRVRLNISVFACEGEAAGFIRLKTPHKMSVVGTVQDLIEDDGAGESFTKPFFSLCAGVLSHRAVTVPLISARPAELSSAKEEGDYFELIADREIEIERSGGLMYNSN